MIYALIVPMIAAAIGYLLGLAAHRWRVEADPLVEAVTALLPNARCGQCGYPSCGEAAKALVAGDISTEFCPQGNRLLASQLASLLGLANRSTSMVTSLVAAIDSELCDGCNRCFISCSFDAIVGAPHQLHGVIADSCAGCGQCVSVCPHHCITLKTDPILAAATPRPMNTPMSSKKLGATHA